LSTSSQHQIGHLSQHRHHHPHPHHSRGDEGLSRTESPELGVMPPLRPHRSPRWLKKFGTTAPASISAVDPYLPGPLWSSG
jgi:hypothetical protein